ncbi:hydroxymethylglutaryl-CoA lyase [Mycobacterium bouchedurhonense]|uniref:Hydroxymethylglutaryl-CoA lyase n=5 Tax=Mycobacterium TaxID=1763 RepID=A0ABX3SA52_MYCBC|nr:hydroxymethylglutaryl-CoA lyase [Mycobacterium bouchedurhonense]
MVMRMPSPVRATGLPERVTIYEVGPRDGLQNETGLIPTDVKVEFIERLGFAGLQTIEAAGFVHPGRVPQLADAESVIGALDLSAGQRYPVLVPTVSGLDRAFSRGVRDIAVFGSATETFSQRNLGRTIDESLTMFAPVVERAREAGASVRGYVSMCCGDPWEGSVPIAKVVDVATRMMKLGCTQLALGDTIGVGTPGQVRALIDAVVAAGIDVGSISVHFHDTYGQALANVLAALQAGVTTIDSSAGGLGGCPFADSSAGNLATEDLVWMLEGLGIDTGVDLDALVSISLWMAEHLGRPCVSRTVRALAGCAVDADADREPATVSQ